MSSPFDAAMAAADAVQNVVYGELVEIRPRSEVPRRGQAADVHREAKTVTGVFTLVGDEVPLEGSRRGSDGRGATVFAVGDATLWLSKEALGELGYQVAVTGRPGSQLRKAIDALDGRFSYVLIDCPPSLSLLTLNGLTAADSVMVPLQCETLAHRGVGQLLRTVTEVQQITNPNLDLLGAIATIYDARTTHSRDVLADVADRYDLSVINPPIPRTVRFAEASASGVSVLRGRKNKGAVAYRELAENLWKHWSTGAPLETFALDL